VLPFHRVREGWALYAEGLGTELGLYKDDPFGDLGRLQAEMFRAVRLVGRHRHPLQALDARAGHRLHATEDRHARGRSRDGDRALHRRARAGLRYKIGMLRIARARERAQRALGSRFNVETERGFHDVVLGTGALPLEVLDEQVDAWIKTRQ
jgi:uncharacterized protein (DUF885 family)